MKCSEDFQGPPRTEQGLTSPTGEVGLARPYKGTTILVTVGEEGFEHEGILYRSLSAVAKAVTGSHCSGHRFFGLTNSKGRAV